MINFHVAQCRVGAVRAVSLVVVIRRMVKRMGLDTPELEEMEREFRDVAAELQRFEGLLATGPIEVVGR